MTNASFTLPADHAALWEAFTAGRRTALARAISIVENRRQGFEALMQVAYGRIGRAHRVGLTGPPGAGKSTLTSGLVAACRARGETVGVIAIDPTSPFTGGALLGDRIRMNDVALDDGVFIRSMATRGSLGGLAITTKEIADLMDAFGFDRVFIETVGVGQSELDVAATADSTVVVLVPESGDSIQAMKAGLMEIADLFVINKSDRPGADRLAREIEMMLHLRLGQAMRNVPAHHGVDLNRKRRRELQQQVAEAEGHWSVPVLQTMAEQAKGVPELLEALDKHRDWLQTTGELSRRRRARLAERVREAVDRRMQAVVWTDRNGQATLDAALDDLEAGVQTPYEVADRIVKAVAG